MVLVRNLFTIYCWITFTIIFLSHMGILMSHDLWAGNRPIIRHFIRSNIWFLMWAFIIVGLNRNEHIFIIMGLRWNNIVGLNGKCECIFMKFHVS
ncbi:hypothetical protein HanRHA438_Chr02g0088251 [Helianthus annuus]|nr:hypothetical protein HanRHA438_Chr02g0088251 [Helianthus annuus]